MAMFEKSFSTNNILDDTENIVCTIENALNVNKHTEYVLRVQRGPDKEDKWKVSRRYRDFAALHVSISLANIELPLPPKKLIGNMQPSFIAERQCALQRYIDEVLKHQILVLSLQVRSFLDPKNYSIIIAEQALQTVSIALRGEAHYELKNSMLDIGWRIRKHYFIVTNTDSKINYFLSWQNYGMDRSLSDKDLQTAVKCLQNLSHPYIDEILAIHNLETGAYVVRKIHENGSMRDILYGTDYKNSYLAKYGNPKVRKPFTEGQIAHYGYQILQALKFLHEKGIPHGHIHPGNIVLENQKALLTDVENFLFGVSSLYRPYILQAKRAVTAEAIDVYCFGRTLYEMTFASPMQDFYQDDLPYAVGDDLESILRSCVSSFSCSHGFPTIACLLSHPFFARVNLNGSSPCDARAHLKFPIALKDEIKKAVETYEARLKKEKKAVRNAKREVRIQEILSCDQEMRKQIRRAKKLDSVWKSTSSLAETVRSQSRSGSTASSPTTEPNISTTSRKSGAPSSNSRSALLDAICGFDKSRLTRVPSS